MPHLTIALLGAPQISVDDESIQVDTRKAIALLAYLAVTGHRHRRDALTLLLWPDLDQSKARAALRRTLSALNQTPVANWIEADRENIELRVDEGVTCDVWTFKQIMAQGTEQFELRALEEAVALYRDDFMAGFGLRDAVNFDDWQYFEGEAYRNAYATLLDHFVAKLCQEGDYARAILHARRRLQLDPLHEPSHRTLMRLYAWSDQRTAALRQYRSCVTTLEEELGVPPLAETTALYDQIVNDETLLPPTRSSPGPIRGRQKAQLATPRAPQDETYPLVGRASAWQQLAAAYATAQTRGCLVVVEGEAGIGKTRLLSSFLAALAETDASSLTTQCYAAEHEIAYGPIIALLRAGLNRPDAGERLRRLPASVRAEAARLLPELESEEAFGALALLDSAAASGRFFEALTQTLQALVQSAEPGVIVIDNAHWADPATLDFLAYFLRRIQDEAICVVLALRSEHLRPVDQLHQLISDTSRQMTVHRLVLERLDAAETVELIQASDLILPDQADLAQRLWTASEGLPLVLIEYLDLLTSLPAFPAETDWALPQGVRELFQSRVQPVSEAGRQLLTAAAAIGRSFDYDLLQAVSGRTEEECVTGLEELLAYRLVREMDGLTYDFYHDQLRALVYEEASAARRRLLHRRIAEALVRTERGAGGEHDEIPVLLARHYAAAGMAQEAIAAHVRAAQNAAQVYANQTAIEHLEEALALGYPQHVETRTQLGDLYMLTGEFEAARNNYEAAAARASMEELPRLEHRLGRVHHRLGHWTQAMRHFDAALDHGAGFLTAAERAQILADWSLTAHRLADQETAMAYANAALVAASGDEIALARVYNLLSILARHQGETEASLAHARESLAMAAPHEELPSMSVAAHNSLALAYAQAGKLEQAIEAAQAALTTCRTIDDRHHQAALHNNLADFYHKLGREEEAMANLKAAVTLFAAIGESSAAEASEQQPEIWMLSEW